MTDLTPTIYVVDDDLSVRKGLRRLLRASGYGVEIFESALEFLRMTTEIPSPACLVLDVKMPDMSGIELQEKLQEREYSLPIVFITGHGDIPMSVKAIKTGAINFLTKPFEEKDLLKSIKEALEKDVIIRSAISESEKIGKLVDSLTPREYEILTYVITGMLNKQIAYSLDISEKTVKVHRGRVMGKLMVNSVADLVRLAENAGIEPVQETGQ